jgi:3-hydroxyisobutyrate dehydrogenase-like beta-hydroxyacid dehydrogenase
VKIGFVGLGNMGNRLAACLAGVGDLSVYDAHRPTARPATPGRCRPATG